MTNSLSSQNAEVTSSQADDRFPMNPKTASSMVSTPNILQSTATSNTYSDHASEVASNDAGVRRKLSKLLRGKEAEWTAVVQKDRPLQLLDLPMDILREIVKEVTHTNDLTALALTHSALQALATPHIYSRFDIVWPDATASNDTRTGVDALTFGLTTLASGQDVMGYGGPEKRRLGNHYAQYTRKFSIGNGPADWIQDYMINKESGKLLGTLVALAVARMINLETFIWDMPTGVLRDIWAALSSLPNKSPSGVCRLEKVLVRWHDNTLDQTPSPTNSNQSIAPFIPPGSTVTSIGISVDPPHSSNNPLDEAQGIFQQHNDTRGQSQPDYSSRNRVEYPTLSVLPPLKSLSVLDIDELSYLDEMSVLIEKSKDCLQELRVGISKRAQFRDFVLAWDGPHLQQVDSGSILGSRTIGERRLGGVLGILLGRIHDIRKRKPTKAHDFVSAVNVPVHDLPQDVHLASSNSHDTAQNVETNDPTIVEVDAAFHTTPKSKASNSQQSLFSPDTEVPLEHTLNMGIGSMSISSPTNTKLADQPRNSLQGAFAEQLQGAIAEQRKRSCSRRQVLYGKLKLSNLELERVPLSITVLQKGFDWTVLTSLTILDCAYHEGLWRMLRRQFQPRSQHSGSCLGYERYNTASKKAPLEYQLSLKKLHTDIATPALISFLKETLAPNTLEVLFLQDRRKTTTSSVTIDSIYRGPLRRHRRSLKKLLIDSSDRIPKAPNNPSDSSRWRTWMLTHEVLTFITSGSMVNLRELSVAIDYKDWHFLLRRLPQVPTLRSLNIPFIADHATPNYDPRELALQIVNMIFLRPEIELCYVGISNKCFEILENRNTDDSGSATGAHGFSDGEAGEHVSDNDEDLSEPDINGDEDEEDDDDDDDDDDDEDEGNDGTATEAVEAEGHDYANSDQDDSDTFSSDASIDEKSRLPLRLREILFYDDRIDLFRARHMRL